MVAQARELFKNIKPLISDLFGPDESDIQEAHKLHELNQSLEQGLNFANNPIVNIRVKEEGDQSFLEYVFLSFFNNRPKYLYGIIKVFKFKHLFYLPTVNAESFVHNLIYHYVLNLSSEDNPLRACTQIDHIEQALSYYNNNGWRVDLMLNAQDERGETLLMKVILVCEDYLLLKSKPEHQEFFSNMSRQLIDILLNYGASIETIKSKHKYNALDYAKNCPKILELLTKKAAERRSEQPAPEDVYTTLQSCPAVSVLPTSVLQLVTSYMPII